LELGNGEIGLVSNRHFPIAQFKINGFRLIRYLHAMILPSLIIAPSEKGGRGVFASEPIPEDTVIEVSPVLVLTASERIDAEKTVLFNYLFEWGENMEKACVAWGYLSLYNHSYHANCVYEMDMESDLMRIRTVKKVEAGEELLVNYNADADDETPIWFEAK
jgi:SET domain-containing protein